MLQSLGFYRCQSYRYCKTVSCIQKSHVTLTSGLLIYLTFYWFFVTLTWCTHPNPTHLSVPTLHPCKPPPQKKEKENIINLIVAAIVCHSHSHSNTFVHTSLLANVHCTESWVCFETSGFCYSIYTWFSLRLFLDFMMLPCVLEIMQLLICRTSSFMCSSSS
jgi:hypothetical protein